MATYTFTVVTTKTGSQVRAEARERYLRAKDERQVYIMENATTNGAPTVQRTVEMDVWQAAVQNPETGEWRTFGAGHEQKAVAKALNWVANCTRFTKTDFIAEYDDLDFDRDT